MPSLVGYFDDDLDGGASAASEETLLLRKRLDWF
jgi:hypothetical protein